MTDFTNKDIEFGWVAGENGWGDPMNENLQRISNLLVASVLSATTTTPPGSPADGDGYLIPAGATGVWAGSVGSLAYWSDLEADYLYFIPARGWQVWAADTDALYYYTGSAWQALILRVASGVQLPGSVLKLGTDATGTDTAATDETVTGPLSTGTGTPAAVIVRVGVRGSTGTDPQTPTEAFRVQEIANASSREVAARAPVVVGGLALGAAVWNENGDTGRFLTRIQIVRFANTAGINFGRANGTEGTPSALVTNDAIGAFNYKGYDSSNAWVTVGQIFTQMRENLTSTTRGSTINFSPYALGTTTQVTALQVRAASASIAEWTAGISSGGAMRIIPATSSTTIAFRDSTNAADTFTVNAAGTASYLPLATAFGVGHSSNNASAIVQFDSTTRGFLPPRMTTVQRNAISTPAAGLVIYNTTTNKLNVYTTAWEQVTSA